MFDFGSAVHVAPHRTPLEKTRASARESSEKSGPTEPVGPAVGGSVANPADTADPADPDPAVVPSTPDAASRPTVVSPIETHSARSAEPTVVDPSGTHLGTHNVQHPTAPTRFHAWKSLTTGNDPRPPGRHRDPEVRSRRPADRPVHSRNAEDTTPERADDDGPSKEHDATVTSRQPEPDSAPLQDDDDDDDPRAETRENTATTGVGAGEPPRGPPSGKPTENSRHPDGNTDRGTNTSTHRPSDDTTLVTQHTTKPLRNTHGRRPWSRARVKSKKPTRTTTLRPVLETDPLPDTPQNSPRIDPIRTSARARACPSPL